MPNLYAVLKRTYILLLAGFLPVSLFAQAPTISYSVEVGGLSAPINIANAGDGSNRLFIPQQAGIIYVKNGATLKKFADFGTSTAGGAGIITAGGEQGLLGMAFHPQYDGVNNRYFYLYHNDVNGDIAISRCQTKIGNVDTADGTTITNIITVPHPGASNHNGGHVAFGPDGYLYFATGDGGGGNDVPNNAQNGDVLLGKVIRINVDQTGPLGNYVVPADNPYVGDPNIDDRVWALGLRNPYRWSFDRLTGDMWIGDVGQNAREEVNFAPAGATGHINYGWRCFEGHISTPGVADCTPVDYVKPVFDYPNPDSGQAVTGGYVYRGTEYPTFYGRYIATDVYSDYIFILSPNGSGGFDSTSQASAIGTIVAFGEGEDGTLYAVSQATNTLYKVVASGGSVLPVSLIGFSGSAGNAFNDLKWKTAAEINTARFNIEYSKDGAVFINAGTVAATRSTTGSSYTYRHNVDNKKDLFYRLASQDDNGSINYSNVIRIAGTGKNLVRIYPNIISNGNLNLELNGSELSRVRIINATGTVVFTKQIKTQTSMLSIPLPGLSKGMYIVELEGNGSVQTEKIFIQ